MVKALHEGVTRTQSCANKLPVNIIMKVTRNCNFRCEYCHDLSDSAPRMPFEVIAQTIERALANDQASVFRFIWHGGEPLLVGVRFFLRAVALQQEFRQSRQEVRNNLQTNGSLLDDEAADFLKDYGFNVGVSLDGPEPLHDAQRTSRGGKPTFKKVLAGLERLKSREIPFGVITVLTSRSLAVPPDELLAFYRNYGISNVCLLGVRSDSGLKGEMLEASSYAEYMRGLFDAWLRMNDPELTIREFSDWILLAMGLAGRTCASSGSCVGTTFCVEPDGTVYHCDKFAGHDRFRYGHISELDMGKLRASEKCRALRTLDLDLPKVCRSCFYRKHCAGGCGYDRYLEQTKGLTRDHCHLRDILTHVRRRIGEHPTIREFMDASRQTNDLGSRVVDCKT